MAEELYFTPIRKFSFFHNTTRQTIQGTRTFSDYIHEVFSIKFRDLEAWRRALIANIARSEFDNVVDYINNKSV